MQSPKPIGNDIQMSTQHEERFAKSGSKQKGGKGEK